MTNRLIKLGRDWQSLVGPTLLVAVGLGFALIPLASGKIFFYWDNAQQHYPQSDFLHRALRSGHIPHWWSQAGLGFPTVAEGQSAHYHPVRLLFTLLFSPPVAFMAEIGFYLALAGLGTYLFLREFKLLRSACIVGGLSQMFGSYSIVFVGNIALHRSFCFLPLAMLLAERFVTRRKVFYVVCASIILGLQLLAGHPTFMIVTVVATSTYILCRVLQQSWHTRESLRPAALQIGRALSLWGGGILLGLGLAAIQVLPTLLHVNQSIRQGGLKFEYAVIASLPAKIRYLPQLLFPYAYVQGDWLETPKLWGSYFNDVPRTGLYVGALPVLLALLSVWWHRRWPDPGWPLVACLLIATAFALGAETPLFPALWSLPVMRGFRFPGRFLMLTSFCLSCLAALGLHRLVARGRLGRIGVRDSVPFLFLAGSLLLLALFFWTQRSLLSKGINVAPDLGTGIIISLALFASAFGLSAGLLMIRRRRYRIFSLLLVILFVFVDLWVFRVRSGYAPAVAIDEVRTPPPVADFLKTDPDQFRVMSLISVERVLNKDADLREFLQADTSTIWGVESAEVWCSLMLKRYYAVHEGILWELTNSPGAAEKLAGFLAALNVKYVVAPQSVSLRGWEKVYQTSRAATWKNPVVSPRAFLVGQVMPEEIEIRDEWFHKSTYQRLEQYYEMVANWQSRIEDVQIVDNILSRQVDYQTTAVVAGTDLPQLSGINSLSEVLPGPQQVDEMRFDVRSQTQALLVIANNYYPGWTATVNGVSAEIHRTNYVEMGVFVPAGRSEVVLAFVTPGFRLGMFVSLVSLGLCLAVLVTRSRLRVIALEIIPTSWGGLGSSPK